MIHLITSPTALKEARQWIEPDHLAVIAGDAINALNDLDYFPCDVAIFSDDASLIPNTKLDVLTMDQWIQKLEQSPCRTWS
ncbi:MAG TPA: hypothetical protein DEF72_00680 [Gammaproteobacteria bacterium]|nr:hypothetical protein [Gammaproteobacteria bacterium]|tara:strand:- start:207 stop:449 length:243 start_codon:yes stop_codon:yes gene_type:complete